MDNLLLLYDHAARNAFAVYELRWIIVGKVNDTINSPIYLDDSSSDYIGIWILEVKPIFFLYDSLKNIVTYENPTNSLWLVLKIA